MLQFEILYKANKLGEMLKICRCNLVFRIEKKNLKILKVERILNFLGTKCFKNKSEKSSSPAYTACIKLKMKTYRI